MPALPVTRRSDCADMGRSVLRPYMFACAAFADRAKSIVAI
jgi:hypothetical protein